MHVALIFLLWKQKEHAANWAMAAEQKKQQGKVGLCSVFVNLVHFLPNQMQTDICGADTCGFYMGNILQCAHTICSLNKCIVWAVRTSPDCFPSGRCWGYTYGQHEDAWFLWQLMQFPFGVKRGQIRGTDKALNSRMVKTSTTWVQLQTRVQSQTKCIWSPAIKIILKSKGGGRKKKTGETEGEKEESVSEGAQERLYELLFRHARLIISILDQCPLLFTFLEDKKNGKDTPTS